MAQETINKCTVSGYITNIAGDAVASEDVTIVLANDVEKYGENTAIKNVSQTATTDANGLFSIDLVENESMNANAFYIATINSIEYKFRVKNEASADFWDLVDQGLKRKSTKDN